MFKTSILLIPKESSLRKITLKHKQRSVFQKSLVSIICPFIYSTLYWTFKLISRSLNRYRQRGQNLSCKRRHWFQDVATIPWICQKYVTWLWTSCPFTPHYLFRCAKEMNYMLFHNKDDSLKIIFLVYSCQDVTFFTFGSSLNYTDMQSPKANLLRLPFWVIFLGNLSKMQTKDEYVSGNIRSIIWQNFILAIVLGCLVLN